MQRLWVGVFRVVTGCAAVACALGLAAPARAQGPDARNCGWALKVSGDQANILYPDEAAKYWAAILPIPPGGAIEAKGRFPHARYLSFHTYDVATTAIDALADVDLVPDPGSLNPFKPGADRTTPDDRRGYTIRMVGERKPAGGGAPNTIYTENADGSKSTRSLGGGSLTLRVYEADRGLDDSGGVGLPTLTLVAADGTRTTLPECGAGTIPDVGATQTLASSGFGAPLPANGLVSYDPPRWTRYTNAPTALTYNVESDTLGDSVAEAVRDITTKFPSGGFAENEHNKYVFSAMSPGFGQVLVLRGKLPTTPRTYDGEPTMGTGELRYWSMCTGIQTTQYLACHNDDAIPVDDQGRYTIAVSTAAARPANARTACGVAWLPAGPLPQTVLFMRNMLPDPGFRHAVQNAQPGTEERVLGDFYPRGEYFATPGDVERKLGCDRDRAPAKAVSVTTSASPKACPTRRTLTIRLRGIGRDRLRSITVTANGKRLKARRVGRRSVRVVVKTSGRQRITVRVRATTRTGRRLTTVRRYRACKTAGQR